MNSFINIAKESFDAYQKHSTPDVSETGGPQYSAPHNGYSGHGRPEFNEDEVVNTASREGNGDHSLFSSALGFLKENKGEHEQPIDEEGIQQAHRQVYQEESAGSLDAGSLGSAAALQVLKMYTSGSSEKSSGGSQTQLISFAMAEASKLFDKYGGAASGNKQDAVNGAAMTVMKLLVQSKFGGGPTGGENSGGLGGLMSLATKFL